MKIVPIFSYLDVHVALNLMANLGVHNDDDDDPDDDDGNVLGDDYDEHDDANDSKLGKQTVQACPWPH